MNTYINMMKKAKCNDEAVAILRKIKIDIKEPEEMKKTMKETEKYYFTHLKEICTKKEYNNVNEFVNCYIGMKSMCK